MDLLAVLDELRSIAQNGLRYAYDPYDEERYDRILRLVTRCYGETFDVDSEAICERFREELKQTHVTPGVGAQAGIFDSANRILLQQRADTGTWGLPGRWIERTNYRPVRPFEKREKKRDSRSARRDW